ncbi:quinone oxidoreductase family protein [Streptomyces beijiangensis]|uniref:Zinc-binding dehydrogenase n=1 Tax=Streptomyces beijiangensis TaxID=163361 RepID=A0A939F7D3_9ACTN|nr:zinc-binding dehydrogenase [Streptomyces beijiangensis]MBO0513427.1 zinc-binding dehydrogenase [Streptomyces beijiangensis]
MRAIQVTEFGAPEVLREAEVETPEPGPGQVSIDVAYAGVNFADLKARSTGYRVPSLPFLPGLEVAGRVRALGAGVEGLTVGQEVAALTAGGGYAEVAVASATTVFPVPAGLSLRTAATLPTVLPTAHALVHEVGRLGAGETVLVQGAAGGVGTVVGQLAKLAGAGAVYGVVSRPEKAEYALKYGYDQVFVGADWADQLARAAEGRGADLILDSDGGEALRRSLDSLAPFGRIVNFGNSSDEGPWQFGRADLDPGARSVTSFSILTLAGTAPDALRDLSHRAFALVADGKAELPVTAELPLSDAAEAHRLIETRTTTGKLLLRVAP